MNSAEKREHTAELLPHLEISVDEDLKLKQLSLDQAAQLYELVNRDRDYLRKWLPWPDRTRSVSDSEDFIALMLERRRNGEEYGYGIALNGKLIGHTSLMHLNDGKDPEIGYWLASETAGKGVATKITRALTGFGLEQLGLSKIIIRANPGNIGSNKVAEKSGYVLELQTTVDDELFNVWSIS